VGTRAKGKVEGGIQQTKVTTSVPARALPSSPSPLTEQVRALTHACCLAQPGHWLGPVAELGWLGPALKNKNI